MDKYILDESGNPIVEEDILKWGAWFQNAQRHVAATEINGSRISTVFLGIDHSFGCGPPLLWESMIFGGEFDGEQERYSTLEDAKRGHDVMVGRVTRQALPRVPFQDMH